MKDGSVNRRHVLQGVGAAGVAGMIMAGSGMVSAGGSPHGGRLAQSVVKTQDADKEIPTGSQFWSFNNLFDEGYTNVDLIELSADAGLDTFEPYNIDPGDNVSDEIAAVPSWAPPLAPPSSTAPDLRRQLRTGTGYHVMYYASLGSII